MDFRTFCESQGIQLLPDDLRFIRKSLQDMPKNLKRMAMEGYVRNFKAGIDLEKSAFRKQNSGRFMANTFLRLIGEEENERSTGK